MQNDQRLTPLPISSDIQSAGHVEFAGTYPSSYDDTLDSKRSIKQYINVIYKRLPLILAITIIVTAAVAFYSYRLPSEYQTETVMIIEPRKPPQTSKETTIINFGDNQTYYNTQLQLLKDPGLMKRAVIALGLHRDATALGNQGLGLLGGLRSLFSRSQKPEETNNSLPIVSGTDDPKSAETSLTPEENNRAAAYAAILVGGLSVTQQDRTNIVTLTLKSPNPAIAPKITDKIAELFIKEDADRETNGAETALKNLRKSIEELKATIHEEEDGLIEAMKSANLPLQEKGGEVRAADLSAVLTQYRLAETDANKAEADYSAAVHALNNGEPLVVVSESKTIQDQRAELIKLKQDLDRRLEELNKKIEEKQAKLADLRSKYQDEYSGVRSVNAELVELQRQRTDVSKESKDRIGAAEKKLAKDSADEKQQLTRDSTQEQLSGLRTKMVSAQQRLARAREFFEKAAAKANIEGQEETSLVSKKNELKSNQSLLDTYNLREKEQDLALATDAPKNIKLQANAGPAYLIGPQRGRNILVAFFLSLGAGIGLAFLLDFLDDSVRTSDDITRHLGLPTLALIPHYLSGDKDKKKLLTAGITPGGSGVPASAALITMGERHSPMAEAYRHLRTSLLFSSAGKPPQTILVTSSQPSEGKTTTAINTAITLAQGDADVVIIDCDLRRPRLHQHFGLENTSGLTNYLSGDKNTENLMRTYKDLPRLKVITSGPIPPNPAELLSSNEMRNLLQFLSGRFKHVIIDSPPAISFTDASILSTLVDGVVLVAMANKSSIHLMRQFKQRVSAIGARIYGVVLNGITSTSDEYYYYGSGYYKYYSQADDDESTPLMDTHPDAKIDDTNP